MYRQVVFRILGILLIIFSSTMIPPAVLSLLAHDNASRPFLAAYGVTLLTGLLLWLPTRRVHRDLRFRDGFMIVVLFWTVLTAFGSIPFLLSETPSMPSSNRCRA